MLGGILVVFPYGHPKFVNLNWDIETANQLNRAEPEDGYHMILLTQNLHLFSLWRYPVFFHFLLSLLFKRFWQILDDHTANEQVHLTLIRSMPLTLLRAVTKWRRANEDYGSRGLGVKHTETRKHCSENAENVKQKQVDNTERFESHFCHKQAVLDWFSHLSLGLYVG